MTTFAETEKIELKQKFTESIPKEIVAFLNTDGGTVYIGVDDNGVVCGVKDLDETLKKVADVIENQILPDSRPFVELGTKFVEQKHVVEIKVKKGDGLYYIKKYGRSAQGCYLRVGTTCRSMTEEQIRIVHNKFLDASARITEIASRTKNPTFQYLKLMLVEKGYTINETTFAENFHLLTKEGEYNKMAELLADKNEVSIKVVRFKGKQKADGIAIRNEYGDKCLLVAMKQAFDYCADVINETHTSFRNGMRVDTPLFDRTAFREAWFNACLHNNWVDGTPPAIYIYTDRLEIISTGGLPANLTKEDFFRGVSKPVNEELAKLFIRLDLMEQTGYGVPRVTQSYGQEAFEFLDFFIRVTVPFAFEIEFEDVNQQGNEPVNSKNGETAQKNGEKVTENVTETGKVTENVTEKVIEKVIEKAALSNEKLSDNQMAILRMIIHNPFVSKAGLAESVGISLNSVSRNIEALRGKYLHRVGPAKGGYWEILQGSEPINPNDGETVEKTVEKTGKTVGKTVGKTGKTVEKTGKTVEKTAEKLVGIIKVNSKVTIKELTSLLNITRRGVEEQIKSLKDKGIIRRVGPAKGGHWELLQQS